MFYRATMEQQGKGKVMRHLKTRQSFLPHPAPRPALLFLTELKQQDDDSQGEAHNPHDPPRPRVSAPSPHTAVTIAVAILVVLFLLCYLNIIISYLNISFHLCALYKKLYICKCSFSSLEVVFFSIRLLLCK